MLKLVKDSDPTSGLQYELDLDGATAAVDSFGEFVLETAGTPEANTDQRAEQPVFKSRRTGAYPK